MLIDAGGPVEPILEAIERFRLTVTHVLLTHHHGDHVANLDAYRERFGVPALAHPLEAARLDGVEGSLADGDLVESGDLRDPLPAHAGSHRRDARPPRRRRGVLHRRHAVRRLGRRGARTRLDVVRGSAQVGDGRADGPRPRRRDRARATSAIRRSAWSGRRTRSCGVWRGLDAEGDEPCIALGEPATLVLWGDDYDGGYKAWVRWPDGRDDIVPGSRVERRGMSRPESRAGL